jgi:hypothetical protein
MAREFTIERPRKKQGEGRDPLLHARAPAPLIALVRVKARERRVSVSEIIRDALRAYAGISDESRAA